jgi:hypothetical protein
LRARHASASHEGASSPLIRIDRGSDDASEEARRMIDLDVISDAIHHRSLPGGLDGGLVRRANPRRWVTGIALFAIAVTIGVAVIASERFSIPRQQSDDDRAMEEWLLAEFDAGEGDMAFLLGNTLALRLDPGPVEGDGQTPGSDDDSQAAATADADSNGGSMGGGVSGFPWGGPASAGRGADALLATLSDGLTLVTTSDGERDDADGQTMVVARADGEQSEAGSAPDFGLPMAWSLPIGSTPRHAWNGPAPGELGGGNRDGADAPKAAPAQPLPSEPAVEDFPASEFPSSVADARSPDPVGAPTTPLAAPHGPAGDPGRDGAVPIANPSIGDGHPVTPRDADPSDPLSDAGPVGSLDAPHAPPIDVGSTGLPDYDPQAAQGTIPDTPLRQVEALAGDPVGGDGGEFLPVSFEDVGGRDTTDAQETDAVPEPSTLLLIALGLVGLGTLQRHAKPRDSEWHVPLRRE